MYFSYLNSIWLYLPTSMERWRYTLTELSVVQALNKQSRSLSHRIIHHIDVRIICFSRKQINWISRYTEFPAWWEWSWFDDLPCFFTICDSQNIFQKLSKFPINFNEFIWYLIFELIEFYFLLQMAPHNQQIFKAIKIHRYFDWSSCNRSLSFETSS